MRNRTKTMLTAIALVTAIPAVGRAQEAARVAPASAGEVVVTGKRTTEQEVGEFVGILEPAPGKRQLARFERRAVCPAAIGLSPSQRAAVVNRLRKVAAAARIPVADVGCKPNVVLAVTGDKPALMNFFARDSSRYFPGRSAADIRALVADPAPATAWQLLGAPLNADGVEMQDDGNTGTYVNRTTTIGSRISAGSRPQFGGAIVVVSAGALTGLTTTQLADYAAMRAFAQTDPAKLSRSSLPTILTVLDAPMSSEIPITLTRWDLDLLRSLYASPKNLSAASQRSAVTRGMTKGEEGRSDAQD